MAATSANGSASSSAGESGSSGGQLLSDSPLVILTVAVVLFVAFDGPIGPSSFSFTGIYPLALAWGTVWGGGQEDLG